MKDISTIVKDAINLVLASVLAFIFGMFLGIDLILSYEEDAGVRALYVVNKTQKPTKHTKSKSSAKNKIGYDVSNTEVK